MNALMLSAVLLPFAAPLPPAANVPSVSDRSEPVSAALEKQLNKKAGEITAADLANVTELQLPHIHPKAKAFKDYDFAGLTNLKKLEMFSLFHNNGRPEAVIAISGKVFQDLAKLEELRMTSDQLGQLPDDVFSGLTSLRILDLTNITLPRLPKSLLTLPKIEAVYFDGRGMSKEDYETMKNTLGTKLKPKREK
jgi:hypothetical protein